MRKWLLASSALAVALPAHAQLPVFQPNTRLLASELNLAFSEVCLLSGCSIAGGLSVGGLSALNDGAQVLHGLTTDTLTVSGSATLAGGGTSVTPSLSDNSTAIATTAWVKGQNYGAGGGGVSSFNTRTGPVSLTSTDVTVALGFTPAPLAGPSFISGVTITGGLTTDSLTSSGNGTFSGTGYVKIPAGTTGQEPGTPSAGMVRWNTTTGRMEVYTGTAWQNHVRLSGDTMTGGLTISSGGLTVAGVAALTGGATAPTVALADSSTNVATTAWVKGQGYGTGSSGVSSFNTRIGPVTLASSDVTTALGYTPANLVAPSFTGGITVAGGLVTDSLTVNGNGTFTGTGDVQLPSGTTGQEPGSPVAGMLRWNTTTSRMEVYDGSTWQNFVKLSGDTMTGGLTISSGGETLTGGLTADKLTINQTGGSPLQSVVSLTRNSGGLADAPLVSGTYTIAAADGSSASAYNILSLTTNVNGSGGVGPAGDTYAVVSNLNVNSLRSLSATANGSQTVAVTGSVIANTPSGGIPAGRRMQDQFSFWGPLTNAINGPSSQGGAEVNIELDHNTQGLDDLGVRYIYQGTLHMANAANLPAEIAYGLYLSGVSNTQTSMWDIGDFGGAYSNSAGDYRFAANYEPAVTSVTPGSPTNSITVDNIFPLSSGGLPIASTAATTGITASANASTTSLPVSSATPLSSTVVYFVYDLTNPSRVPANTTITGISGNTLTTSTSTTVLSGDLLLFAPGQKSVMINGHAYTVAGVQFTGNGSPAGTVWFTSNLTVADATNGVHVLPSSHTLWLWEGSATAPIAPPGDLMFNRAGTVGLSCNSSSNCTDIKSTAPIDLPGNPTSTLQAATKGYVDAAVASGGTGDVSTGTVTSTGSTIARTLAAWNSDRENVLAFTGADPTDNQSSDNSTAFNAAAAITVTGGFKDVYAPGGTYHLKHAINLNPDQCLIGDGWSSVLDIGPDFDSTANGVVVVNTTGGTGTQPCIIGFQFNFQQVQDLVSHTTSPAAEGATTLILSSAAGVVVGDYVADQTNKNAIVSGQAAEGTGPTVTAISGNQITISQPVQTGSGGVGNGDSIHFAPTRSMYKTLAQGCTVSAGGTGCKYPWAIYNNGANTFYADHIFMTGAWDGIYQRGGGFYLGNVFVGAIDVGLDVDNCHNSPTIVNYQLWAWGYQTSNNNTLAVSDIYYDGNTTAANLGAIDGMTLHSLQSWEGKVNLTANWSYGHISSLILDGDMNQLNDSATGSGHLEIGEVYTSGSRTDGTAKWNIANSNNQYVSVGVWRSAQNLAGSPSLSVSGGVVSIGSGSFYASASGTGPMITVSGGKLNLGAAVHFGGSSITPIIQQSSTGVIHAVGVHFGGATPGVGVQIGSDNAENFIKDENWNGWTLSGPSGAFNLGPLGTYEASPQQATRTVGSGTTDSASTTDRMITWNSSGAITETIYGCSANNAGRELFINDKSGHGGTIDANGTSTVNGTATYSAPVNSKTLLKCDGVSNWVVK